jgi:ABC-type glycerol-3-phosphate transport system substrate-binding protein
MGQRALFDQLKVDIAAGDGPDLIMNGSAFTSSFEPALFMDLSENIDSEGVFENIFEINKIGGKLYTVPLTFRLSGIVCDSAFVRERQTGFTYKEYDNFVRTVCNGSDPIKKNKAEYFIFCYNLMSDVHFYAGETPDYNDAKFKNLAKFVYMSVDGIPMDETTEVVDTLDDDIHATSYTFSCTNDYFGFGKSQISDAVVLGYPAEDSTGPYAATVNSIAVSNATKNKAGCVEFVKLLMSPEMQTGYAETGYSIPVNVESFNASSKTQLKHYNTYRKHLINMGFNEADLRQMGVAIEARERDIAAFEQIICSAEATYRSDPAISLIIKEEMPAYFSGQKDLGAVIEIINGRAKAYLTE